MIHVRILVDAFRERLLHDVPVSLNWNASEGRCDDSGQSACYADTHDNVDGQSRPLEREDAPIL
jgi:hypothetical protein